MQFHKYATENHALESWVYANAGARTGSSGFASGDVGRIAYQSDTGTYWRLLSVTPTWQQVGAPSAGVSGIPNYSGATAYVTGNVVVGSDGNWYRAVASTTGNDPTSDAGANWELLRVCFDATLPVGSSARFTTLPAAITFMENCAIAQSVTLTISIANGTYTLASQITWIHAFGAQVAIVGNAATPADVVLSFDTHTNGFVATDGAVLGSLNGVTIEGTWNNASPLSDDRSLVGILATNGSKIFLGENVVVSAMYYGVQSARNSVVIADGITVSGAGDVGIFAYEGGFVSAIGSVVSNCADTANSLGWGYRADIGSVIHCDESGATTCAQGGMFARGGRIRAYSSTANANSGHGFQGERGGVFESGGIAFQANNNGGDGLHFETGSTFFASTTGLQAEENTGNGIFANNGSTVNASGAVITTNTQAGIHAYYGSTVSVGSSTITGNGTYGADVFGGSVVDVSGSTINTNTSGDLLAQLGSFVWAGSTGSPACNPAAGATGNQNSWIRLS